MRGKRREQNDFDVGSLSLRPSVPTTTTARRDPDRSPGLLSTSCPSGRCSLPPSHCWRNTSAYRPSSGQRSSSTFSLQPAPPFTDLLCGRFGGLPSNAPKRGSRDRAVLACLRRFVT